MCAAYPNNDQIICAGLSKHEYATEAFAGRSSVEELMSGWEVPAKLSCGPALSGSTLEPMIISGQLVTMRHVM